MYTCTKMLQTASGAHDDVSKDHNLPFSKLNNEGFPIKQTQNTATLERVIFGHEDGKSN